MMNLRYLLVVFLFISGILVIYVSSQWTNYHDFEGRCQDCHLSDPNNSEVKMVFVNDISILCLLCHDDIKESSHPVAIKPTIEIPADFPLDWKGEITCSTCHTTHKGSYGEFKLRVASIGEPFCKSCHIGLYEGADMHKTTIEAAHVGSRYTVGNLTIALDELSLKCLVCHDASIAKDGLIKRIGAGSFRHDRDIGLSHPIGVSYIDVSTGEYGGAYRKVEELRPEIILFDGMVGCGSCHNPYSKGHFELVMSNEKSALCLACHIK
jgi:predicted CXXCH cytochrome family protein